jgi:hypothetical protein
MAPNPDPDNPLGGHPFGDAPFGPRPDDEEQPEPSEGGLPASVKCFLVRAAH